MAYTISDPQAGFLPIASTDSGIISPNNINTGSTTTIPTPPLRPGMIVTAQDPTFGAGEFILLAGVASTAVGSVVTYSTSSFTTALAPAGTNVPQPIAIAMSANVASTTWGWYQIGGNAVAIKNAATASLVAGTAVGVLTAGVLNNTATGAEVEGAVVSVTATATASTVQVMINRPCMQGRIT